MNLIQDGLLLSSFDNALSVLWLFIIPFGGGIPAGVAYGDSHQVGWLIMTGLYFISDVMLAFTFEPLMKFFIQLSHTRPLLQKIREAASLQVKLIMSRYGVKPSPFTLVCIAFGVDPMTGRTVAKAYGHGFISGWMIAIIGDMFFYSIIMVSTLWLKDILGDGTMAAIIVMVVMLFAPVVYRKFQSSKA